MESKTIINTMAEVLLPKPDAFLIIRETLTRIGHPNADNDVLTQLCHILHKQGRYFITHYKELFALDGAESTFNDNDRRQRNTVIKLLAEWKLVRPVDTNYQNWDAASLSEIKIIPFHEKTEWMLEPKYHIGKKKTKPYRSKELVNDSRS